MGEALRSPWRPDRLRLTAAGWIYVLLTLILGLAAANTGNNALYLVVALMLALLAVSGVLGWRNLRGIEAELGLPAEVFEGQAFGLPLRLRHRGGRRARDLLLAVDGAPAGHYQARLEGRGRWAEGWLRLPPAMRGRHLLAELRLASYYPFGFLRRGNRRKLGLSVLVYPRLLDGFNTPPAPPGAWEGESARRRHPSGDEPWQVRPLGPGDDPRHINWKQSARRGAPIVVDHGSGGTGPVRIEVDNAVAPLRDEAEQAAFEHAIRVAATVAVQALAGGRAVELITRSGRLPAAAGERQRRAVLTALAELSAVPSPAGGAGE